MVVSPASDYKDKYSHLIGKGAAKDAAHMLQANKTYGCGEATVEAGRGREEEHSTGGKEKGGQGTGLLGPPTLPSAPSARGQQEGHTLH